MFNSLLINLNALAQSRFTSSLFITCSDSRRSKVRVECNSFLKNWKLLLALMFLDFLHTEKHPSKIFQQITIEDDQIRVACLNHHTSLLEDNPYHPLIQYYDGLASFITRKKPFKTTYRYDKRIAEIDFHELKQAIETRQHSACKVYDFIYHSHELNKIVESLVFGKNTLRNHLLLMLNLAINDYYNKKLLIAKGKISISVCERVDHLTKDVETHSFIDQDTATNS